ncbi:MAG: hypothetical protein QOG15_1646, partial [Solirubrobacteraceae bacterium]|nr:hypothetical protein [Solirubrobacteraceae bacterium]
MPVRLHDSTDPQYRDRPSQPTFDRAPLHRATTDDPPLDASHAARYNTTNYGFAAPPPPPAPAPALPPPPAGAEGEADAGPVHDDVAPPVEVPAVTDTGHQPHAEAEPQREFWPRWLRRGQS